MKKEQALMVKRSIHNVKLNHLEKLNWKSLKWLFVMIDCLLKSEMPTIDIENEFSEFFLLKLCHSWK